MPSIPCSKVELCVGWVQQQLVTCTEYRIRSRADGKVCGSKWPTPRLGASGGAQAELILAAMLTAFFLTGALAAVQALSGLALVAIWAAFWPAQDLRGGSKPRGLDIRSPGCGAVVNAVRNRQSRSAMLARSASQPQGRRPIRPRRRGGHITTMVRDPELLAAVEQALATREIRVVELHARVPLARRSLMMLAPLDQTGSETAPALLISIRDLTEQDRLARMRADFVANASHELRTPLASLRGFVKRCRGGQG